MSELHGSHGGAPLPYGSSGTFNKRTSLAQLGGGLGIAGTLLGVAILFGACGGLSATFFLSPLCVILGAVGLILTIVGGVKQQDLHLPDPSVLAAVFCSVFSLVGGLLLMAAWLGWTIFPK